MNPDYRTRFLAQEINMGADDDLYAAIPQLKLLKCCRNLLPLDLGV